MKKKLSLSICSECLHLVIKNIGHNSNITSFEDNRRHFLAILFATSVWLWEIHPFYLKAPANLDPERI